MDLLLIIISGLFWIIVYEECIRLGFKQKTYCMPFFALGLNLAWEAIYSFSYLFLNAPLPIPANSVVTIIQCTINVVWLLLDIIILYTYFKFGKKEWPKSININLFTPWSIIAIICCFCLQIVFIYEFGFIMAVKYSAFLQNLLMSILFINLSAKRGNMKGQSIRLAVSKWIGTLAPTILFGIIHFNLFVLVCGIFCGVFDLIYIGLVVSYKKNHSLKNNYSARNI